MAGETVQGHVSKFQKADSHGRKAIKYLVVAGAIAFGFVGYTQPYLFIFPDNINYTVWLWCVCLTLYWLNEYTDDDHGALKGYTFLVFGIVAAITSWYFITNFDALRTIRPGIYVDGDVYAGAIAIFLTITAAYREFGGPLTAIAVVSLFYAYYGYLFPGVFHHGGLGLERVITVNSVEFGGVFGIVTQAAARWIFVFMIFAGLLKAQGTLDLFIQLGMRSTKYVSSGVAQTAVISSLIIGSVSGSAAANTALTGSFTIPMMKSRGIDPKFAAAIESVASTGGQIMPPVMAIVAFIMADLLQVPYAQVIIWAALPGFIFYGTVAVAVHVLAKDMGGEAVDDPKELEDELGIEILPLKQLLLELSPVIVSVTVLVAILIAWRLNAAYAAFWTITILIGMRFLVDTFLHFDKGVRGLADEYQTDVKELFDGLYQGTMTMIPVTIVIAHLNVIIEVFQVTGFGNRLALLLVPLAELNILVFLTILMIVIIIIGMGAPTVAAYLLTLAVAVPALTAAGFRPEAAHFFVLYCAILSNITPPVAMTVAVAANIAESDFLRSSFEACKIGVAGFTLPFIMILNPSLLNWEFPMTIITLVLTFVGIVWVSMGLLNRGLRKDPTIVGRLLLLVGGLITLTIPPILGLWV